MRVLIIGSGVSGSLVGAALVEAGVDVTFLLRPERQRQLITTGLHITSPLGRFRKPVHAISPPTRAGDGLDAKGGFDVVIVATRAHAYQPGLFVARDVITPATLLVPLLDGVHHLGHWRDCYPNNPIALSRFDVRAMMDADGVVRQTGPAGDLVLGLRSASGAEQLEALRHALDGRRFRACIEADAGTMLSLVWARAIYRAAAAGASRLSGMPLRDAVRFHSRTLYEKLLDEGARIAEARGIPHVRSAVARYRTGFLREGEPIAAPAPIAAGARAGSEALFLLGNMLRQAQDAGVAAPRLLKAWAAADPQAAAANEGHAAGGRAAVGGGPNPGGSRACAHARGLQVLHLAGRRSPAGPC